MRWGLRVKSDGRFKARHVAICWKQRYDCGITFASVGRFDLLAIAAAKRDNCLDVQMVLLN